MSNALDPAYSNIFVFKAGKAINRFDISEQIGHSHKQNKNTKK